jgi:TolA-binding protein
MRAVVALWAFAALAPLQCPSREAPSLAREDSPGDALWLLAERFGQQGDVAARRATLTFLIERYPSSRYAERARVALNTPAP